MDEQVDDEINAAARRLLQAVESGTAEQVEQLLQSGVDANAVVNYKSILFWTIARHTVADRDRKVQLLLDAGASATADSGGFSALHKACFKDLVPVARMLVSRGAPVNLASGVGNTPLHCVVSREMCVLLLQNNADVDAKNRIGETPLFYAVYKEHSEVVQVLLENGAAINAMDNQGFTPLHAWARWSCRRESAVGILKLLLKNGADLNALDRWGETPLDCALESSDLPYGKILLEHLSQQLLARNDLHPDVWAHALAKIGKDTTNPTRISAVYSLLCNKPDLFDFKNCRKRKRPDRFVPGG